jgi:hypothetical protein
LNNTHAFIVVPSIMSITTFLEVRDQRGSNWHSIAAIIEEANVRLSTPVWEKLIRRSRNHSHTFTMVPSIMSITTFLEIRDQRSVSWHCITAIISEANVRSFITSSPVWEIKICGRSSVSGLACGCNCSNCGDYLSGCTGSCCSGCW